MRHLPPAAAAALLVLPVLAPLRLQGQQPDSAAHVTGNAGRAIARVIRVNQVGYLPASAKVAVVCSLVPDTIATFTVRDSTGRIVLGPRRAQRAGGYGPCVTTHRLDFSSLRRPGRYIIAAKDTVSREFRIGASVYAGAADTLLHYMRQQRSGWNPFFRDSVHRYDGIVVDDSALGGKFVSVAGGWADASDYLQYVTTSANAAFVMLMAWRDHRGAFADAFDARGLPGPNGIADVLDEARHGLAWLLRMFPEGGPMFNQLGDDRDHAFPDLLLTDSSDYGWGKGKERPIYPCTGRPQGLFAAKNRSTGLASTAGKYASAFALGSVLFRDIDRAFADTLRRRAVEAYASGRARPGVCQTAPGRAPYFYEEGNWADDMELAAAQLLAATGEVRYRREGMEYARMEPVTPWMGADTAKHYEWFPWHNNGHRELWRNATAGEKRELATFYRRGLAAVAARADNGFRMGVPMIWCSNNLVTSLGTQARLYRQMTGDARFADMESAALDWLFGVNPWGVSMVVGYPAAGQVALDPHSIHSRQIGVHVILGGLLDGPVKKSIFRNLQYIRLTQPDEYAPFNTSDVVYHDDFGDYSTNEPIMDGTANLTWLLAAMAEEGARQGGASRRAGR